jgi:hypothetical protein
MRTTLFLADGTFGPLVNPAYTLTWAKSHFGVPGAILGIVLIGGFWLWFKWNTIQELPFAKGTINRLKKLTPLPRSSSTKFNIAVAHLIGDDKAANNEQLLIEDLRDFSGIGIIRINRTIKDENLVQAQAEAQKLRRNVGANVLLWGRVLTNNGKTRIKLYWSSQDESSFSSHSKRYTFTEDLALPDLFWEDLRVALDLLVATTKNELDLLEGSYTVEQVAPFVQKLRILLADAEGKWAPNQLVPLQSILATSLFLLSEETGNASTMQEAAKLCESALQHTECDTLEWRKLRLTYSSVLARIGQWGVDNGLLERALHVSRNLVTEEVLRTSPSIWTVAQLNLGASLHILGTRQENSDLLRDAIQAYELASSHQVLKSNLLPWAMTQH